MEELKLCRCANRRRAQEVSEGNGRCSEYYPDFAGDSRTVYQHIREKMENPCILYAAVEPDGSAVVDCFSALRQQRLLAALSQRLHMKKIYFTLTGTRYRYGHDFLKPGMKVKLETVGFCLMEEVDASSIWHFNNGQ